MSLLTKAIIGALFFSFFIGAIALLPDASLHPVPQEVQDGMSVMYSSIAPMNYILPLSLILQLLILSLAFEVGYWAWKAIMWIIGIVKWFLA